MFNQVALKLFCCSLILKVVGFTPFAVLSLLTVFIIPATPDTASLNVSGIRLNSLGKRKQSRWFEECKRMTLVVR